MIRYKKKFITIKLKREFKRSLKEFSSKEEVRYKSQDTVINSHKSMEIIKLIIFHPVNLV